MCLKANIKQPIYDELDGNEAVWVAKSNESQENRIRIQNGRIFRRFFFSRNRFNWIFFRTYLWMKCFVFIMTPYQNYRNEIILKLKANRGTTLMNFGIGLLMRWERRNKNYEGWRRLLGPLFYSCNFVIYEPRLSFEVFSSKILVYSLCQKQNSSRFQVLWPRDKVFHFSPNRI